MPLKIFHLVLFSMAAIIFISIAAEVFHEKNQIDEAARYVASELRFARHYAVKNRIFTAVLMPTEQVSHYGGASDSRFQACTLRSVVLHGPPTFEISQKNFQGQFASYFPDRPWIFLSKDTCIDYTDANGESKEGDPATTYGNVVNNIPFPDSLSPLAINNVRAIIFTPEGTAINSPQEGSPGVEDTHLTIHPGRIKKDNQMRRSCDDDQSMKITINHLSGELSFQ